MTSKVYLAGPIQHAADHGKGWRKRLKQGDIEHEADVDFVDPMDKYNAHDDESAEWTDEDIIRDDIELIAACDAVLVHWLEVPTCGTPMEVFFASHFPQLAQIVEELAEQASENSDGASPSPAGLISGAARNANVEPWVVDTILALNDEVPVAIQTRVPPEEISPWLTGHANVVSESFEGALHWIENNVNGGDVEAVKSVESQYELKSV